jgi:tRNA guanosine-2'-O-methyltransferase
VAAFEALAYVLLALSTSQSSQLLDLVEVNKKNHGGKGNFSLDILFTTFLDSINYLLMNGCLTRSRRAVLMNWKVVLRVFISVRM